MPETDLIKILTGTLPTNDSVQVGPGDDCAVVEINGAAVLLKTDAIVEGVHFTSDTPPEKIGRKAIGRPLSDIAAMGGRPTHALVTLGLPEGFDATDVCRLLILSVGVLFWLCRCETCSISFSNLVMI